jgi:hypothetical protein
VRLEGLRQLKNPVTSLGIEPATFRLAAQCLNQLRKRGKLICGTERSYTYFVQYLRLFNNALLVAQVK